MAESLTNRFMLLEKKNEDLPVETHYDSSEFHPEHFGVGTVTGKVFEEIYDQQDEWEIFFTTMFFVGIILIPLQLIFADDLKPYDAMLIQWLQTNFINSAFFTAYLLNIVVEILKFVASVKFFISATVFFYLCFDPGVAFKTSLVAGCGSYIVFILKVITHDSRPFWITNTITPGLCKLSFGSPSLDVFVGMLYSHYIYFCTDRALKSNDPIITMHETSVEISKYISMTHCKNANESTEISIRMTFLDSSSIFHILGAAFGVNFVLKHIQNPFYWFISPWWVRLLRGSIGFTLNMLIVKLTNYVSFKSITSDYILFALIYVSAGYLMYGVLPVLFSFFGLTNNEFETKKRAKLEKQTFSKENDNNEIKSPLLDVDKYSD